MKVKSKIQPNGLANIPSIVRKELKIEKDGYIEFEITQKSGKTIVTVRKAENDGKTDIL